MEIRIGTISNKDSGQSVSFHDTLTDSQHKTMIEAISELHNHENNKRLFEITLFNRNDFLVSIKGLRKLADTSPSILVDKKIFYEHYLHINRLFLNYLSSVKSFIDHSETNITAKYGKGSKEITEFKKATSYYFDNFFAYRFFIKLRNYSQHCGLPLQELSISATRKDKDIYLVDSTVNFNPKELLNNFTWGQKVTIDLKNFNSGFPLIPLINEMTEVLSDLFKSINYIHQKSILKAIAVTTNLTGHLKSEDVEVCIFTNIQDNESGHLVNFETLTIPYDIINDIEKSLN